MSSPPSVPGVIECMSSAQSVPGIIECMSSAQSVPGVIECMSSAQSVPGVIECMSAPPNVPGVIEYMSSAQSVPGVIESLKIVTRENSTRIARFAFDYAVRHGRKKVTAIHKANIMCVSVLSGPRVPVLNRPTKVTRRPASWLRGSNVNISVGRND